MKDYRRQGMSIEQLDAFLLTYADHEPIPIHGRLGCVHCGLETARFFVYTDMLVCAACKSRYALYHKAMPELTHLSTRLRCLKCRAHHWWAGKSQFACRCGSRVTTVALKPVPLFAYAEPPEPAHFGLDAKAEIKKMEASNG